MKPLQSIVLLVAFTALFAGCRKEAINVHPEMIGHWRTAAVGPGGTILEINEETSSMTYNRPYERTIGKAKLKGNTLKIGREEFEVTEFPHYDGNGDYIIKIDGGVLIKSITPRVLGVTTFSDHATLGLWFASPGDQGFTNSYFKDNLTSLELQYKLQSASAWTTITNWTVLGSGEGEITGLDPASVYECRTKAHYPWGDSDYSVITTFTTL
jgi:hypothetical protein